MAVASERCGGGHLPKGTSSVTGRKASRQPKAKDRKTAEESTEYVHANIAKEKEARRQGAQEEGGGAPSLAGPALSAWSSLSFLPTRKKEEARLPWKGCEVKQNCPSPSKKKGKRREANSSVFLLLQPHIASPDDRTAARTIGARRCRPRPSPFHPSGSILTGTVAHTSEVR